MNFDARAKQQSIIKMNECTDVQLNISETTRTSQEWAETQASQHVGPTASVLCDIRTTRCAISKLHLHTTLTLLVVLRTSLGQCRHARMLCARQLILSIMRAHSQRCFQGQCRWCRCKHLGLSASKSRLKSLRTNLDFTQPFSSQSTHRVWITGLPAADVRFKVVMTPISLGGFSSFCRPFFTSSGSSWIVRDCQDLRLLGNAFPRIRFQHTNLVVQACVQRLIRYESTVSTGMSTSSFFVSVLLVSLRLGGPSANVAVCVSVGDFVVNRFFTEVASCVSVSPSPLLELEVPAVRCIWWFPLHLFLFHWLLCGFLLLVCMHFRYCRWRGKNVRCRRDVQCRRHRFLWCFDNCSAVLGESTYASRVHNSFICSDYMFVSEVALAHPHGGLPPFGQLRCGIPRSISHLWKVSKRRFTELQQLFPRCGPPVARQKWGLCIAAPETRHDPSCVSNNPLHQCTVSGRSALRSVLRCCQQCARLSLQLLLIVFHCSVAFMRSSGRTSDDCSFLTFWISHFLPT